MSADRKPCSDQGKATLERDVLFSDWAASHGGVYVPVTETFLPNPSLKFLPEQDIEATDGRRLTLVDPWHMTRLAFDLKHRQGGTRSKITSLKSLNPDHAPDFWERSALQQLEQGGQLVNEVVDKEGRSYVRSMRPFYVRTTCLKCHAAQDYQLGDLHGGISVSIPIEPFLQIIGCTSCCRLVISFCTLAKEMF